LISLTGEDEITENPSVRQVEFAMVFGSALRELYSGFRARAGPRNCFVSWVGCAGPMSKILLEVDLIV